LDLDVRWHGAFVDLGPDEAPVIAVFVLWVDLVSFYVSCVRIMRGTLLSFHGFSSFGLLHFYSAPIRDHTFALLGYEVVDIRLPGPADFGEFHPTLRFDNPLM
jgi:hypothetical protein